MAKKLFICVKSPFSERDYERMGIAVLENHFDLRILDLTAWLMPAALKTRVASNVEHPAVRKISSLAELKRELADERGGYALDYVGQFSPAAVLLFNTLRSHGISIIVIDSGAHPAHHGLHKKPSVLARLYRLFKHGGLVRHVNAIVMRIMLRYLPDQRPDIAFVAGSSWRQNPRFTGAAVKVPAHSFDYELYLQMKKKPALVEGRYAVYLDEKITAHEDNVEFGLAHPATRERFFPAILRFFDEIELRTGLPVVIAGYPSANTESMKSLFNGRQVFVGQTARLLKDASLVFAHGSTAVSYAVIAHRPIAFLTSDEISRSWYQPSIALLSSCLGAPMVNIDQPGLSWPTDFLLHDSGAYDSYCSTYIKAQNSPDRSLWETLYAMSSLDDGVARDLSAPIKSDS